MTDWLPEALAIVRGGGEAVLVTLHATEGSAPRDAGARMLVTANGQSGSIGGGNLEFLVAQQARKLLARQGQSLAVQSYPLGPFLGQCCGGHVGVVLERINHDSLDWLATLERRTRNGRTAFVLSIPRGHAIEKHVLSDLTAWPACGVPPPQEPRLAPLHTSLHDRDGRRLTDRRAWNEPCAYMLEAAGSTLPHIVMFGAGHVGRAVAHILHTLPVQVTWVDSRPDAFPEQAVTGVDTVTTDDPAAVVAHAPHGASYLIFTHSHDLDYAITRDVLRRGDALFCGLIGSATKRARFEKRFLADGLTADDLMGLTCPIGMPALKGKEPEVIAVAVAAQLLDVIETAHANAAGRAEP